MANFGLWWIRWNGSDYESRMSGTPEQFRRLGFDYAVVLGQPAHIQYTEDAETDAYTLAEYLIKSMNMPYYATIPFFTPLKKPRGNITGNFEGSYWERWLNVFISIGSSDPNLRGFYWSLENAWMFKQDQIDKGLGISYEIIRAMSQKIHQAGFEFIWIPSVPTMNIEGTNIFPWWYRSPNYPGACEYFDYVFAQPNYYMGRINNINEWTFNLETSKLKYNCWNVFMEMEADECVIGGGGNCKTCGNPSTCTRLASDYVHAQINTIGRKYPQRAYYFGVTFDVVKHVDSYCRNNLGVPYV